ncbi:hypothetical protein KIPB_007755 [Kipferlia bialata]|uniref:MIB/HERC2 domain-containing protein n=1 Tax=Kipferlia bialata TaxID=797122 RepID=A0A9K3D1D7_9EUKA|nr:hypothetical protein KIPB_007755 [Kipferlia bialata]|eukprot:g7755.t1
MQALPPDTVCASSLRVGASVMRGGDWRWFSTDAGCRAIGTIVAGHSLADWVPVKWDGQEGLYRHRAGYQGKHDLIYAPETPPPGDAPTRRDTIAPGGPSTSGSSTVNMPSTRSTIQRTTTAEERATAGERPGQGAPVSALGRLRVGARVRRGRDWVSGDQDGVGGIGIMVERGVLNTVAVRWPHSMQKLCYFAGCNGKYELEYADDDSGVLDSGPTDTPGSGPSASGRRHRSVHEMDMIERELQRGRPRRSESELDALMLRDLARVRERREMLRDRLRTRQRGRERERERETTQETVTRSDPAWPGVGAVVQADRLRIGAKVLRGPDWKWGNQDGADGEATPTPGTVLRRDGTGMVAVVWADDSENVYRARDPDYDLVYADSDSGEDTLTIYRGISTRGIGLAEAMAYALRRSRSRRQSED